MEEYAISATTIGHGKAGYQPHIVQAKQFPGNTLERPVITPAGYLMLLQFEWRLRAHLAHPPLIRRVSLYSLQGAKTDTNRN